MTAERPIPTAESPIFERIDPMAPRTTNVPIRRKDWIAEIKFNGFRAITYIAKGQPPVIRTSTGRDVAELFPELLPGLVQLSQRHNLVLDGEIVYGEGKTSHEMRIAVARTSTIPFAARYNSQRSPCQYTVFDLLKLDDDPMIDLPLSQRKKRLKRIITQPLANKKVILIPYVKAKENLDEVARELGYEGIVYKKMDSPYLPGKSTNLWLKFKFANK